MLQAHLLGRVYQSASIPTGCLGIAPPVENCDNRNCCRPEIVGSWDGLSSYPVWYPHYDDSQSFSDFESFGTWCLLRLLEWFDCERWLELSVHKAIWWFSCCVWSEHWSRLVSMINTFSLVTPSCFTKPVAFKKRPCTSKSTATGISYIVPPTPRVSVMRKYDGKVRRVNYKHWSSLYIYDHFTHWLLTRPLLNVSCWGFSWGAWL